jgi:hypothetical protein
MHLMIPFSSALWSQAHPQLLRKLKLPHLTKLLQRLTSVAVHGTDEYSLSTPFERALAHAFGWQGKDGCLPWAARAAQLDGLDVGALPWGQLTPVHWHVASDHISLADPAQLNLSAEKSHGLFESMRGLFESAGWRMVWGAPTRWYVAHESLQGLPSASIDRAVGRNIDLWMPNHPQGEAFRTLQSEAQMLLYQHRINDERVSRGALPVNSFWLSGCGRLQPVSQLGGLILNESLREPLMAQNETAWCAAWETLDACVVADALERVKQGQAFKLTLVGERQARSFEPGHIKWWQRLTPLMSQPALLPLMESL